ncbi:MAG: ribosome recycling factor [Actinomycetota bacterium]
MKEQIADAKRRMEGAVKTLSTEFAAVRTGRASTHLLDRIHVEAYGTKTPLNQLATLHAPEPRLLTVQPYDKSLFKAIEKAIQESDLGLTPSSDGQVIRLQIPQLTEERRKDLVKLVHKMAEEARVAVRNVRRDVLNELKRAEKDGDISRDQLARAQDEIQKLTDSEVKAVDELMAAKEAEIREV